MDKIELKILGISSGHSSASYTLILEEQEGDRKLPVVIGAFEAQAIAIQIEKIQPPRPMTHDLFRNMADAFSITVDEIVVHKLEEGVFYANISCKDNDGHTHDVDARTSDAIAIGLRFNCPIYTYESIMNEAGIYLSESEATSSLQSETPGAGIEPEGEEEEGEEESTKNVSLSDLELDELKKRLDKAIESEDYIQAAQIRDEINKREGGSPTE